MVMLMKALHFAIFSSLLFLTSNCFAMAGFNAWSDSQYNYLSTEIIKSATTNSSVADNSSSKRTQALGNLARSNTSTNSSGRYTASPAITQQVKKYYIESRTKIATNPAALADTINSADIEMVFSDYMGKHGLQSHDLSDAMAGYWLTLWTIVHNTSMPNKSAVLGVRNQMRTSLNGNMSNAEKQRHAQMTVLKTVEVLATSRKPGNQRAMAIEMQKVGMRFGMNLEKLDVTNNGFTPKR
jgi:hypothetical protein